MPCRCPIFRNAIMSVLLLLPFAMAAGCGDDWGDGEGEISGTVCVNPDDPQDCESYTMDASFFTLENIGTHATIEILSSNGWPSDSDNLTLSVESPDNLKQQIGQALPLGEREELRLQVHLLQSFGFSYYPLACEEPASTITFTGFGNEVGNDVAASFSCPLIGREDQAARGELHGWFSFRVRNAPSGNKAEIDSY